MKSRIHLRPATAAALVCVALAALVAGAAEPAAGPPSPLRVHSGVRGNLALPGQNQFYDEANPAFPTLQKANEALAGFPVDRQGNVDWMTAVESGAIRPLENIKGRAAAAPLDLDVVMKNTKDMPYVVFYHRSHTVWLDCSNCHPAIFQPRAGSTEIKMADIFRGRFCGVCHDRVAFITFFSCDRCHRIPHFKPEPVAAPE